MSDHPSISPADWRGIIRRLSAVIIALAATAAIIGALAVNAGQRRAAAATAPIPVAIPAPVITDPTPAPDSTTQPTAVAEAPVQRIDPGWAARISASTGIPLRAVLSYASATVILGSEQPGCGLNWNTLAGIGSVESGHASHGGARLGADGRTDRGIFGPALNGVGVGRIRDTDRGRWDGDSLWDRAVGPMQFIPSTWRRWGADGNADGVSDPQQLDDATLAAGRYLCASGSMKTTDGWRAAILTYNHSEAYVDKVAAAANRYAESAGR